MRIGVWAGTLAGLIILGCAESQPRRTIQLPPRYPTLGPKENLPAYMRGTVYEQVDVSNTEPYLVSGYGLVVNLANTGDNQRVPLAVRNYMIDEMVRHGLGSRDERLRVYKPEAILQDPRCAIVEVYALLPVGGRAGQRIDAYVRVGEGSQTSSLAGGSLYQCKLYVDGVRYPRGRVNAYATARGAIFVNPGYVWEDPKNRPALRLSLREGLIMNGATVVADRPIKLRVRTPQLRIARAIEAAIDQYFMDEQVARTLDEGTIDLFVPYAFRGDWEHFLGVARHLYITRSPGSVATRAQQLVEEAQKPNAALLDISYCWEGLGPDVIPFIQPLYTHPSPEVAYAAARAGACVRDAGAEEALLTMSQQDGNPFQLNAVKALGALPPSVRVERMMTRLLSARNALVRIEAYHVLAEQGAPAIISQPVKDRFILDRVLCDGPPLVYATRSGMPRVALFGKELPLRMPIMFRAMQDRFTISTSPDGGSIVLFDRTGQDLRGVQAKMKPDLHELLYRLGGGADDGFRFGYSDVVGLLQGLSDGRHIAAAFVLQDSPELRDAIEAAPPIAEPDGSLPAEAADTAGAGGASVLRGGAGER